MAITNKEEGVWILDEVYNKINQGGIWDYTEIYEMFSWGYSQYSGQVGDNSRTNRSSPMQIPGNWTSLAHSRSTYRCAAKSDGTLWSWGYGQFGRLGQNQASTSYSSPTQIGSGTDWSIQPHIHSCGQHHTAAVKQDGTLWMWGQNTNGQLGQSNKTKYSSPVQIPGTTWSAASCTYSQAGALKTDGTLWTWGSNNYGELGLGNKTAYSSPKQVSGSNISKLTGNGVFMYINTSGDLYSWGFNREGQLGHNQQSPSPPFACKVDPTQIPGSYKDVCTGAEQAFAVKTDGTAWSWGHNSWGELGLNDLTFRSSPTQIGTDTTWDDISAGVNSTFGTKTDGTLWSWGRNASGGGALNDNVKYSSPVQIPGTKWTNVEGSFYGGYALKST